MFTWDEFLKSSPIDRRKMWKLLRNETPDKAEYWEDSEGCYLDDGKTRCPHLKDGWCTYAELPCGVNPYFTPRSGMLGMACMGMVPEGQLVLDF